MNINENIYAVLTGDLVKSSKLTSEDSNKAMAWLREYAEKFASDHPEAVIGEISTFRHDSWQLLLSCPALALKGAVFLRAALKMHSDAKIKFDTRVSIGIGCVDTINENQISDSRGEAFTLSGKGLDSMDHHRLMLSMTEASKIDNLSGVAVSLMDCIVSDWSSTESRAIYGALKGWTQEEIAKKWPSNKQRGKTLTRQAVSWSLFRAHWKIVEPALCNLSNILDDNLKATS